MIAFIKRKIDFIVRDVKIWTPCNVYPTAKLGDGVSVGRFSEIGHKVVIGNNTRIGMGVFIPDGVIVGNNCFIGPKVCMVHDVHMKVPPFPKDHSHDWKPIRIGNGVRLGANSMIMAGVTIGEGAIVGMGSVVLVDIGKDEVWAGNPARFITYKETKEVSNG